MAQSPQPPRGFFQILVYLVRQLLGRPVPQPQPPQPPHPPEPHGREHLLTYFVPGQVLMLAEYEQDYDTEEVRRRLLEENPILNDDRFPENQTLKKALAESFRRAQAFPRTEDIPSTDRRPGARKRSPLSLLFVDVPELREDGAGLVRLITAVNRQISDPNTSQGSVRLSAVTPNWLASGAGHNGSVGGPGARPIPDPTIPPSSPDLPPQAVFKLPIALSAQAGDGVDVAILDTAPSQKDITDALRKWSGSNALVDGLLNGRLQICHAPNMHLLSSVNVDLIEYPFPVSNHGLFVAGIIHSIAPMASLRLIEVLNPHGVGTVETLVDGLAKLLPRDKSRPLVINCSLMITIPIPEHAHPIQGTVDPAELRGLPGIDLLSLPLDLVFNALRGQHISVVAAAGNDNPSLLRGRPPARQPAAFESVIGIGALNPGSRPQLADYSNTADDPVIDGIFTFGGATQGVRPNRVTDPAGGILGLYIEDFPTNPAPATLTNTNGWARWAGTSFATPVVSGALAGLLSAQPKAATLAQKFQGAEDQLFAASPGVPPLGRVFDVTQG
jgi:hypothetical protein